MNMLLSSRNVRQVFCVAVSALHLWGWVAIATASDPAPATISFNRDIRPILSDNCFHCHGPDANTREADLRLDTPEGLLGTDEHPAVVSPGSLEQSELYQRLVTEDADLRMPPASSHKALSPQNIQRIAQWIREGASFEGHWAFQPLRRENLKTLPATITNDSAAIDFYVQQALDVNNYQPAPPADTATLIRRLYLDLVGLPPTPEEVKQFTSNPSEEAYIAAVDRLLASPHYGERLAIWWLDLVRYADTVGYHGDQDVSVSPFRDYVIRSFNDNKPFDQFTIEQLAGDLLSEPTTEQQIASGYNRLGMMSAEGGVQPKEYLAKYIAERVRNVSGAWLGVTMGCCECHDHKFDPFSTREFYQMEAFFADIKERGLYAGANADGNWGPNIKVPSAEQAQQLEELTSQIAATQAILDSSTPQLEEEQRTWEQTQVQWLVQAPASLQSKGDATLTLQDDQSVLASGESPADDVYTLKLEELPNSITALRLEVIPDLQLPNQGSGRASNGNFVLTELKAALHVDGQEPQPLKFSQALATYEQTGAAGGNPYGKWAIAAAIDGDEKGAKWGWAVMEQAKQPQAAVFLFDQATDIPAGSQLVIELHQAHDNPQHTIGRFRLAVATTAVGEGVSPLLPTEIQSLIAEKPEKRSEDQQRQLASYFRSIATSLAPTRQKLGELKQLREQLEKQIPTTLVTEAVEPRMVRVLPRGNWMDDSGEVVEPGFPAAIVAPSYQLPTERRLSRMDLAQWITSADHPLTARTFVNRIWKLTFGAGLSRRLDDLGAQGEPPSHPELLDYLALRFVETGWDIKALVRAIVLSDAYRRSSLADEQQMANDPYNQWLGRQGRFRLDAELVRDNALAISGLLVRELGGASVKPYQPAGYWAYLNFPTREWANGKGEELYRRGLYTHWQRQYLHPSLLAFDAPNREECAADRARSNTPLQSLVLLNDPSYVEAARALAARILREAGDSDDERIELAMMLAVSRPATADEKQVLVDLLQRATELYRAEPQLANELVLVGDLPAPTDLEAQQLAAWMAVTRTILNLHETISRY